MSTKFIRFVAVLAILVSVVGNTGVARADLGASPRVSAQNLEPQGAAEPQLLDLPALNSPAASSPGVQFLHVATAANTIGDLTYIDHPLTNGKPDAIILVTPNWNPGHVGGTADDHPISVGYNGGFWGIFNQDGAAMPVGAAFNVIIPTAGVGVFVQTATTNNIGGGISTTIDNPLTNGHPNAIILVTPNRDPGGICPCVPTNFPIGVYYDDYGVGQWTILNQNHTEMPVGAAFNVFVLTAGAGVFVQTATTKNVGGGISTTIDNPLTNGHPNAIVFVTPNYNPGGVCGCVIANFPIGVYYDDYGIGQWTIFNQDNAPMPVGAAFNVLVLVPRSDIFINTKTNSATGAPYSLFDNALTNGHPNAIVFTTQNWNPGGVGGKGFDQPIGVAYLFGRWGILVQNHTDLPAGTAFNVVVPNPDTSVFVHKATTANILSHSTIIDYPLTNGNPNAIIFVTHNYDPGGIDEVYLNEAIGVFYDGSKWRIYNESGDAMTVGAAFNVFVPTAGPGVGVFVARFTGPSYPVLQIDNPLTNGNPNAIILVTHNYSPGGVGSVNADFPIGVRYYSADKKWGIFSQDGTNMTNTTAFNVYVFANHKVYLPGVRR